MTSAQPEEVRPPAATVEVPTHMWSFAKWQPKLSEASREIELFLTELAQSGSIQYHQIQARAKGLESYEKKADRSANGVRKYTDPLNEIYDCIAARIIFFTKRSEDDFIGQLEQRSNVREHVNPGDEKHNGYDSEHYVVTDFNFSEAERTRFPALTEYFETFPGVEIQLRTVAGHAWAEYEHDVRYKPGSYSRLPEQKKAEINQRFSEAGELRRFIDQLFTEIDQLLEQDSPAGALLEGEIEETLATELNPTMPEPAEPFTPESLEEYCLQRYPGSRVADPSTTHEVLIQLMNLGISSATELDHQLADVDQEGVWDLMSYRFAPSAIRRLDDEILSVLPQRWVQSCQDSRRKSQLQLRARRLQGKFTIYSIRQDPNSAEYGAPLTASQALRRIAEMVAIKAGIDAVKINGFVSPRDDIPTANRPWYVTVGEEKIYVAARVTRDQAEDLMHTLLERIEDEPVGVFRAGDLILQTPKYSQEQ